MLSKKKASIVSEILVLIVSLYYLYQSIFVLKWQKQWFRSGSLFPLIISFVVSVACLAGLWQDIFGSGKNSDKKIRIGDLKRLPLILTIMIAELFVWQKFNLFYVSMYAGTALMIYLMNVLETNPKKRIGMALGISTVFIIAVYILFDMVCKISL